jgi:hypothetical protein
MILLCVSFGCFCCFIVVDSRYQQSRVISYRCNSLRLIVVYLIRLFSILALWLRHHLQNRHLCVVVTPSMAGLRSSCFLCCVLMFYMLYYIDCVSSLFYFSSRNLYFMCLLKWLWVALFVVYHILRKRLIVPITKFRFIPILKDDLLTCACIGNFRDHL